MKNLTAFAVKDTHTGEYVNFSGGRGPHTLPDLDIRCLRTEAGCRSWRRGNYLERRDLDGRYQIIRVDFTGGTETPCDDE